MFLLLLCIILCHQLGMIAQSDGVAVPLIKHLVNQVSELRKKDVTGEVCLGTEVGFAKEFGISRMTVRRALDNLIAQGLIVRRRGKGIYLPPPSSIQQIIQFVAPNLLRESAIRYLKGVQSVMEGRNYALQIYDGNSDYEHVIELIDQLPRTRAAGAIIMAIYHPAFVKSLLKLQQRGHPFVILGYFSNVIDVPMITSDSYQCGYEMGRDLLQKGHRRIGHIAQFGSEFNRQLSQGLHAALNDEGIGLPGKYRIDIPKSIDPLSDWTGTIHESTRSLMEMDEPPSVILYHDDRGALLAYQWFRANGYNIPDDISVIGVGNHEMGRLAYPPLSTVVIPGHDAGGQAVEMLEQIIMLPETPAECRKLEAHWVCRESVRALN